VLGTILDPGENRRYGAIGWVEAHGIVPPRRSRPTGSAGASRTRIEPSPLGRRTRCNTPTSAPPSRPSGTHEKPSCRSGTEPPTTCSAGSSDERAWASRGHGFGHDIGGTRCYPTGPGRTTPMCFRRSAYESISEHHAGHIPGPVWVPVAKQAAGVRIPRSHPPDLQNRGVDREPAAIATPARGHAVDTQSDTRAGGSSHCRTPSRGTG
jgi:hypothetical protein